MANYCNKICHDYYCEMNAKGRCHAPNPCLGYEEAAELISELKAAKRERGNSAALREAALAIRAGILKRRSENCWYATDSDILEKIDAALAAPPRNCDRFASAEEAWDAYDECVESYRAKSEVPPFNEFGWLFAPATEKEGGAK